MLLLCSVIKVVLVLNYDICFVIRPGQVPCPQSGANLSSSSCLVKNLHTGRYEYI